MIARQCRCAAQVGIRSPDVCSGRVNEQVILSDMPFRGGRKNSFTGLLQSVIVYVLWPQMLAVDHTYCPVLNIYRLKATPVQYADVTYPTALKIGQVVEKLSESRLVMLRIRSEALLKFTEPGRVAHRLAETELV